MFFYGLSKQNFWFLAKIALGKENKKAACVCKRLFYLTLLRSSHICVSIDKRLTVTLTFVDHTF